jgi:hypothetical protein
MHAITFFRFLKLLCGSILICTSCKTPDREGSQNKKSTHAHGEYIYRLHKELLFVPSPAVKKEQALYPWEKKKQGNLLQITKEYFRCKGSALNPMQTVQSHGETINRFDCGGSQKHSLPLRDGREFIYPILIDLLNYIQTQTGKRVVITSGHRCPEHHLYISTGKPNLHSKHQIGAEVSFYVHGLEHTPEAIVKIIQNYYLDIPKYKGQKEFEEFKRYEKEDIDTLTPPLYNKEVFIKIYTKKEGRDFDNRHPFPYISLQVRYDFEQRERVIFSWDAAYKNYFRK